MEYLRYSDPFLYSISGREDFEVTVLRRVFTPENLNNALSTIEFVKKEYENKFQKDASKSSKTSTEYLVAAIKHFLSAKNQTEAQYFFDLLKQKDAREPFEIKRLEVIEKLMASLKDTVCLPIRFVNVSKRKPFMGYNIYPLIRGASIACSFITKKLAEGTIAGALVANRLIPEGEIVIIDKPYVKHLQSSSERCSYCYEESLYYLTCLKCNGLLYCSVECKLSDEKYHKYECDAIRVPLSQLIDVYMVTRALVKGLEIIKNNIFNTDKMRNIKTADDLYNCFWEHCQKCSHEYCNVVLLDPSYGSMSSVLYINSITIALNYSMYLLHYTSLRADFLAGIEFLEFTEILIFIGALIMRHSAQTKVFIVNYNGMYNTNKKSSESRKTYGEDNAMENVEDDSHQKEMDTIKKNVNLFFENVARLTKNPNIFTQEQFAENCSAFIEGDNLTEIGNVNVGTLPYSIILSTFETQNHNDFIYNRNMARLKELLLAGNNAEVATSNTTNVSFKALYPTVAMITHSCDPNLFIVMQSNGIALVRASRRIEAGEKLTISYGPHYKLHAKNTRQQLLQSIGFDCKCSQCMMKIDDHGKSFKLQCKHCGALCSTTLVPCDKCHNLLYDDIELEAFVVKIKMRMKNYKSFKDLNEINHEVLARTLVNKRMEYKRDMEIFVNTAYSNSQLNNLIDFLRDTKKLVSTIKEFYPDLSVSMFFEYLKVFKALQTVFYSKYTKNSEMKNTEYAFVLEVVVYLEDSFKMLKKMADIHLNGSLYWSFVVEQYHAMRTWHRKLIGRKLVELNNVKNLTALDIISEFKLCKKTSC